MDTIVGVFRTRVAAAQALNGLLQNGVPQQAIIFLTGDQSQAEIASVPTTDAESDGMGKTLGSYVGGIMGAGAGLYLGSALASLAVPGVGPILAAGIGAAAALGLVALRSAVRLAMQPNTRWMKAFPRTTSLYIVNC